MEPHLKIIFDDSEYHAKPGKNNFFYAAVIYLFLTKIKLTSTLLKNQGMNEMVNNIIN